MISQRIFNGVDIHSSLELLYNSRLAALEEKIAQIDKGDSNQQIT
jgi:hypothetical protein